MPIRLRQTAMTDTAAVKGSGFLLDYLSKLSMM
jgi:hypothetical protein